jgi:RNA polymerase sigma factor (sigma-70 family)
VEPKHDALSDLVARARAGDVLAQAALPELTLSILRKYATKFLRTWGADPLLQPDDLASQTYRNLLQRYIAVTDERELAGFAVNEMKNLLRERHRERGKEIEGRRHLGHLDVALEQSIDDITLVHEALERLRDLNPRAVDIVELRFYGGFTTDETARVLGLSPSTVKSEWQSAKLWLRDVLGRREPETTGTDTKVQGSQEWRKRSALRDKPGPGTRMSVLISSTIDDLSPERAAARRAVGLADATLLSFEKSATAPPIEAVLNLVRRCDVFVGIYGRRYGSIVPGLSTSWTQLELDEARRSRKPILIYRKAVGEMEPMQEAFLSRAELLEDGRWRTSHFRDAAELETRMRNDLRLLSEPGRSASTSAGDYASYIRSLCSPVSFGGFAEAFTDSSLDSQSIYGSQWLSSSHPSGAQPAPTTAEDLLAVERRIFLSGSPGMGKTSLLRHLALQSLEDAAPGSKYVPVFYPLGLWRHQFSTGQSHESLEGEILRFIAAQSTSANAEFVRRAFRSERTLLLLDGLDEAGPVETQRTVAGKLDRFARTYPSASIVVTSRSSEDAGLPEFRSFKLLPWDDQQIAAFVRRLSHAITKALHLSADPELQAENFRSTISQHPALRELSRNPLFLTIFLLLHRQGYRLPQRRVEAYEAIVTTILRSREHVVQDRSGQGAADFLETVLSEIALQMALREERQMTRERLDELVRTTLRALIAESAHVGQFLEDALQAGLLLEIEPGIISFSHVVFQEYFAARAITRMDEEAAVRFCINHIQDVRFREIVRLALSWIDPRSKRRDIVPQVAESLVQAE